MLLTLFIAALLLIQPTTAAAETASAKSPARNPSYQVLYAFTGGADGGGLWSNVVFDDEGNLYGTTSGDGAYGYGVVFELTPMPNGQWFETVLYNFQDPYTTGEPGLPFGGPTLDASGNIYGTTQLGGTYGYGAVFKLTPGGGAWDLTVLHSFGGPGDFGCCPWGTLIMDRKGNLLGTGGSVAFEVSPVPDGSWIETALHHFTGQNGDGAGPQAGVIMDKAGNLYGTTAAGGGSPKCPNYGCGTVYQLRPVSEAARGPWSERILHAFGSTQNDGQRPLLGQLAMDRASNLYGTTQQGGATFCDNTGCGTIFELSRVSSGGWVERILYNFVPGASGSNPGGGVVLDKAGNLYGTTGYGGSPNCGCGVVYKLARQPGGKWEYTVLHTFTGFDGALPVANMIFDDKGNLYGTTATGGAGGVGVVFELTP